MKTLILYYSKTGNTKKYAEDIAKAVNGEVMDIKKFKSDMIDDYDNFVFGGRVMGSRIRSLEKFIDHYDEMTEKGKNMIVFAVGMSLVTAQTRRDLILSNILDNYHVRFYQLRGGFDYSKLSFTDKILMNNSLRMIANNPNATADQQTLLTIRETPIEVYDQAGVERIIKKIIELDKVVEA